MIFLVLLRRLTPRARKLTGLALVLAGLVVAGLSTVVEGLLVHGVITALAGVALWLGGNVQERRERRERRAGPAAVPAGEHR